ncbi:MAG TPA: branched-chain amino acid ABC transporter permease [Beijerinckiaceae bacterium]|nr:branched-chain amino acid ABC transporter permease [Beijerinckiaceae bacterium]
MSAILPLLVDGLAEAALIFFIAVGLTLVFSVLRILNVAHGSFYSIGAYVAVVLGTWIVGRGFAPALTLLSMVLAAALVAALLGPLIERTFVRWTYGRPEAVQILVTFGLFLIFEDLQKLAFGVQAYYQDAPMQLLGVSTIGGIVYLNYSLVLIGLAVAVALGLRLILARTRFGKLVSAVVADREVAQTLGIDTERVFVAAFTLGVFLAALGGALASATSGVAPGLGAEAIVLGFAVAAIGGLGQIEGALIAAVIVGIARVLAIYYTPELQPVAPYLVMLAVLLVRPFGLFGTAATRRI